MILIIIIISFCVPLYLMYRDAIKDQNSLQLRKLIDIYGIFLARFIFTFCGMSTIALIYLILDLIWSLKL